MFISQVLMQHPADCPKQSPGFLIPVTNKTVRKSLVNTQFILRLEITPTLNTDLFSDGHTHTSQGRGLSERCVCVFVLEQLVLHLTKSSQM